MSLKVEGESHISIRSISSPAQRTYELSGQTPIDMKLLFRFSWSPAHWLLVTKVLRAVEITNRVRSKLNLEVIDE